jgi:hypothetical protein
MTDADRRASCRELFKMFDTFPLASKFLLSSLSFVVDSMVLAQDTDIISTFQILTSVNIKQDITILVFSYLITFQTISKV